MPAQSAGDQVTLQPNSTVARIATQPLAFAVQTSAHSPSAEGMPFTRGELDDLLALAGAGVGEIIELQQELTSSPPGPWVPPR